MQTGVKIGIAVAVFVAVILGVHFIQIGMQSKAKADANMVAAAPPGQQNRIESAGEPAKLSAVQPPVPGKVDTPAKAPVADVTPVSPRTDQVSPSPQTKSTDLGPSVAQATPTGKVSEPGDVVEVHPGPKSDAATSPAPKDNSTPGGTSEPITEIKPSPTTRKIEPTPKPIESIEEIKEVKPTPKPDPGKITATPGPLVEEEYSVQPGDSFSTIAQKKYGDAKYYTVIAKANPNVDSSRLRIGQKLKVPPLPKETGPTAGLDTGTTTDAAGRAVYIVKSGDSFWSIAEKHYGNGKYSYLIKDANPKVDSASMKVGQPLVLPPKPATAASGPSRGDTRTGRTEAEPTLKPGEELYVVQAADSSGFWGIAAKKYGDGNLHPAIAKANPTVDATRLRIGQKLVLPSLEDARKLAGVSEHPATTRPAGGRAPETTRPPRPREGPSDDGKPRFD